MTHRVHHMKRTMMLRHAVNRVFMKNIYFTTLLLVVCVCHVCAQTTYKGVTLDRGKDSETNCIYIFNDNGELLTDTEGLFSSLNGVYIFLMVIEKSIIYGVMMFSSLKGVYIFLIGLILLQIKAVI